MILQVVFAAILCTGIASNTSTPLRCYHCSETTPEECTGSLNKTVKTCAANQTCGALVNFRNNSQEPIQQFVLDCVDEEFCQGVQDACKGGFGGNCTRRCNCDKCNDATVNRTSRDISLNNTCPTPAPTPTPPFQCYHCSLATQEECSEPGQTIVKNCTAGQVCRALLNFNHLDEVKSGFPKTNQYHLDCVPPSFCEIPNECKTDRLGHRFGTCFGCCNCSLCNEPTVNLTVPDVSVETCPIPYPTPTPPPTPPPLLPTSFQCYHCFRATQEECSEPGQTIVKNCTAGQVCRALAYFQHPDMVKGGFPKTNQYDLDCVPPSVCEIENECKTERFGHRFGTCFGCCNCSLCNEPTVNLTVPDVSVETCSTPPIQCYSCGKENGTCTAASITEDHLVTCQIGQICSVQRDNDNTFIRSCQDRKQCTPWAEYDHCICYDCCEVDKCNNEGCEMLYECDPIKCVAATRTSPLSVLLLAIAGVVNYWLLMANHY